MDEQPTAATSLVIPVHSEVQPPVGVPFHVVGANGKRSADTFQRRAYGDAMESSFALVLSAVDGRLEVTDSGRVMVEVCDHCPLHPRHGCYDNGCGSGHWIINERYLAPALLEGVII